MALEITTPVVRFYPNFESFGPLMSISEFDRHGLPATDLDPRTIRHLSMIATYCRDVLTRPDPSSGRAGPVCPYSRRAVARDLLLLTHCRLDGSDEDAIADALEEMKLAYLHQDSALCEDDRLFHAVAITFPHIADADAAGLIERLHARLKPGFTDIGLMFGEFYPTCDAGGLHNPDFRPLQTPVPALVIRHMTVKDAPFLIGNPRFQDHYIRQFGEEGRRAIQAIRDGKAGLAAAEVAPLRSIHQTLQPS